MEYKTELLILRWYLLLSMIVLLSIENLDYMWLIKPWAIITLLLTLGLSIWKDA